MIKECEELLVAASAIEQILNSFGIGVEVDIKYTDGSKRTINVHDVLANHVVNYVNSFQPYKFEDLHENMWVWDDKFKDCVKIAILFEPCNQYPKGSMKIYHDLNEKTYDFVEFEENRFFPIQKANEVLE